MSAMITLPHGAGRQGQLASDASPCLSAGPLAILDHPGGRKRGPCIDLSRAETPQSLSAAHCERQRMVLMSLHSESCQSSHVQHQSLINAQSGTAPPSRWWSKPLTTKRSKECVWPPDCRTISPSLGSDRFIKDRKLLISSQGGMACVWRCCCQRSLACENSKFCRPVSWCTHAHISAGC